MCNVFFVSFMTHLDYSIYKTNNGYYVNETNYVYLRNIVFFCIAIQPVLNLFKRYFNI